MKGRLIWSIFWALVGVFVIMACTMFIPLVLRLPVGFNAFSAWIVFAGLGVTLLGLTVKAKMRRMLKIFLLLTGASAAGLAVFVILHNMLSALLNTEEPVFFIIATIVCPIVFLIGAVGTIVLAIKNKPPKHSAQNI